ncbi:general transcription factor II-I repeat domain-containing protein 2-like [Portunus trituberculatus]|uniref:general transcription factor II-I repeat domain-containing protein 2-like n=1 Tax=Portunus trituberculatus TaxID=210409 RepID=UPI001E1CBB14|nr:general transcription factor II-I repeat domain-containing protein 2-like [Portunus trituberculatus]
MVDITKYLSELNVKLQGPNQLLSSLLSNVKSFEAKLKLWKVQLERSNTVHFPTLQEQNPSTTDEYAGECAKLIEAFSERFKDMKSKQQELNIFATPFNVVPADVPDNLQHEIIQLQSDDELKARYNNLSLLEFYRRYQPPKYAIKPHWEGESGTCELVRARFWETGKQADWLFLIHRGTVADHTVSFVTS